jgi:hypothetical protein
MAAADNDDVEFLWVQHGKGAQGRTTVRARPAQKERELPILTAAPLFAECGDVVS